MRLVAFALSAVFAFGPLPAAGDERPATGLVAAIPKAVVIGADYGLGDGNFGYFVTDVESGEVVAELNADQLFIPASVAKIPSTAAALEILGADHRFETTILIDGKVADGVLEGSLTIRGGGDPLLTGDHLLSLAQEIGQSGITKVTGGFHYDTSLLTETSQINDMQPEVAGYNPGVSALSVNFNRVRMLWRNKDEAPTAEARAVSDNVTLPLNAIGFAPTDDALPGPFARARESSEDSWVLSPKLSERGEDWLPVGNPALVAAEILRQLAAKEGVTLPEPTPLAAGAETTEVGRHQSPELADIVRVVLRYSNNMAAELVGLAASRAVAGRPLTLEESAETLANYWRLRVPEADWNDFVLENHSGLSTKSRITPRQMVTILEAAADPDAGSDLYGRLRAASWKAPNGKTVRIRAKTGTMAYARGLAGYIDTANGRRLAFAVFFNDLEERAALDAAFDPRVENLDPQWRRWRGRALKLEQKLIGGWATGSTGS